MHQRAGRPAYWTDIEAGRGDGGLLEHSDYFDVGSYEDDHQDDDQGIISGDSAPNPWEQRNGDFAAQMKFTNAIEAINAEYERRARPYVEQQRRNPGPVRPELAALIRQRDSKIRELARERQVAQAMEWAARDRPGRVASAHERQGEQAAARSFAIDLGKGRFLPAEPEPAGRDVRSTWRW